jgi:hypothetical protein
MPHAHWRALIDCDEDWADGENYPFVNRPQYVLDIGAGAHYYSDPRAMRANVGDLVIVLRQALDQILPMDGSKGQPPSFVFGRMAGRNVHCVRN